MAREKQTKAAPNPGCWQVLAFFTKRGSAGGPGGDVGCVRGTGEVATAEERNSGFYLDPGPLPLEVLSGLRAEGQDALGPFLVLIGLMA
jgi:hypothetical protein